MSNSKAITTRSTALLALAAALILTTPGAVRAQQPAPAPATDTTITMPLSPDDADAILDPSLWNVPGIPVPQVDPEADRGARRDARAGDPTAAGSVDHNLATGRTTVQPRFPASGLRASAAPSGLLGNPGTVPILLPEPSGFDRRGNGAQRIFGADDRVRILNTAAYPWRTQCKLFITFPNGTVSGSGTMIGYKYVVTAGHCVYSANFGGWATSIRVVPGLSGSYMPYGQAWATRMRTFVGWTRDTDYDYDLALITLDRNLGSTTGWLGSKNFFENGVTGHTAGYPGDRDGGLGLYYTYGRFERPWSVWPFRNDDQVTTEVDMMPGQSGSGIYEISGTNNNRQVFAVVSHEESSSNRGTALNGSKYDSIRDWMATGN